ncbi:HigA family addiction module antitoxin [Dyella jiangningensis]|uniref:Addiction module antidote protein, HigA family n=1 Tax=Dyella jiangningensis TaxID=1379159 RepID=A0A328P269_9GAMM|nr:HigA family addiction module antitoxin [Dyella jiangningensis]RAO76089.1 addiction module antidote protein, HigA family [Dyella jiangningensis]
MDLIQLTPRMDVDPSVHLRSPGEVLLLDYMLPATINPSQLARRTGIRALHLREILTDARPMTPRHAIRLALVLDTSPLYWLVLQARHDLAREAQRDATLSGWM